MKTIILFLFASLAFALAAPTTETTQISSTTKVRTTSSVDAYWLKEAVNIGANLLSMPLNGQRIGEQTRISTEAPQTTSTEKYERSATVSYEERELFLRRRFE